MPLDLCLWDQNFADIRLIDPMFAQVIAMTRHGRAAVAAKLFIPRTVRMVLADPPYAKADWTVLIHRVLRDSIILPADAVRLV